MEKITSAHQVDHGTGLRADDADFNAKHPHEKDGKFAKKGSGSSYGESTKENGSGDKNSSKIGPFGPVLTDFHHNAQGAIKALSEMKDGEAIGALHHPDIGDIDLPWGVEGNPKKDYEGGYGLAKIAAKHPEVIEHLQEILSSMKVNKKRSSPSRIRLESADHEAAVSLDWYGQKKTWLITEYEMTEGRKAKKKEGAIDTSMIAANINGMGNRHSSASSVIIPKNKGNGEKADSTDTEGEYSDASNAILARINAHYAHSPRIQAAGCIVIANGKMLFIRRSQSSTFPGQWNFPGGHVEPSETLEDAARRETKEETGFMPDRLTGFATVHEGDTDFTVFLSRVNEPCEVTLSDKSDGAQWLPLGEAPEPLLPGCAKILASPAFTALRKFSMPEIDVARAIINGEMPSPQTFGGMWMFAIRITGTGMAFRRKDQELVYRTPADFLNDDFLLRCNGLPVIWEHPDGKLLNPENEDEFKEKIVGTTFMPYIASVKIDEDGTVHAIADPGGDEVWAIAKIYDKDAANMLMEKQLSTSPGVRASSKNGPVMLGGATLLVEGNPLLVDHIAICSNGVWDKGGEPSGVSVTNEEGANMAEDKEVVKGADSAEDVKKADADDTSKAQSGDNMQAVIDSLRKRIDSLEAEKKADRKADDDDCPKDKESGKADDDEPEKDEGDKSEKADADDDKAALQEALKKADSAEAANGELRNRIAELERHFLTVARNVPKPLSDEDYAAMAHAQAKADSVYAAFGGEAPRAMNGEGKLEYRKRLAAGVKKHSKWKDVDFSAFDAAAFDVAESQVYADAMEEAMHPTDVSDNEMRETTRRTAAGHTVTTFRGPSPTVWMSAFQTPRMKSRLRRPATGAMA